MRLDTNAMFICRMRLQQPCPQVRKHWFLWIPSNTPISVLCEKKTIYSISLSCSAQYIWQTGRCLNNCLEEHFLDIFHISRPSFHLNLAHVCSCEDCTSQYQEAFRITVLSKYLICLPLPQRCPELRLPSCSWNWPSS